MAPTTVTAADYQRLLQVRTGLREFLRWSEDQANQVGLTGAQHQLLLAVKGHDDRRGPTISDVAGYLTLKHHSAVGLVDRAERAGLVTRHADPDDRRVTRLALTRQAEKRLAQLSALHLEELARLAPQMAGIWKGLSGPHARM
ncbi:MarR family winged helix-turn-helix transcriptional regulator [Acidiferrimicrobium sp. IK]|uniref:MarR family winged helix-turn-helix transcriptional regulator n=1 Tax=Acidiferrimicrobium sp. IK TaxID=2871700 RepID=UPI0021CB991C|nr:MarR family winged helix-turn-helix transcriptional regulator [Acidiferrimicrobium sp. IK]MCU4183129.1 MarR family winged helix-turn-helix transcriptional regulator [Acidiferrimicrobium sp. IK]